MAVWGIVLELSILGLLASTAILARSFGVFTVKVDRDRSLRFLQAAWAWGPAALVLLALMPAYTALKGVVFSHAWFGGYRHAFTVGFISLMIIGVSSKIVRLEPIPGRHPPGPPSGSSTSETRCGSYFRSSPIRTRGRIR
jgi:hypothetical protein